MLPRFAHFDDDCEDTADPMNILFLEQTASGLERTLHGITNAEKNKKWKKPSYMGFATARDQWLHISGDCRVQDEQCVVGAFWDRYHIRLWEVGSDVIANCHHEDLITIGGNPRLPRPHYPTSFDTGKNTICEDFRTAGRLVTPAALPMRNNLNDPACDGNAALIG
jgi:hypothetical protein